MVARLLTRAAAAEVLRRSIKSVDRLIANGDLPAVRIGSRVLVDATDLDELIQRRRTRPEGSP